jgi:uncharacterized membrane protein YphA (DoxX/SURF4 family)
MKTVTALSAFFLGIVFIVAGVNKLFNYSLFVKEVSSHGILRMDIIRYLTFPLILAEIWTGLGLFVGQWRKAAAMSSTLLLMIFTIILFANYLSGSTTACGCLLPFESRSIGPLHIIRDLVLLGLSIFVWLNHKEVFQHSN